MKKIKLFINKIKALYVIGGLRLCFICLYGKIFRKQVFYSEFEKAQKAACKEDYPKILSAYYYLMEGKPLHLDCPVTYGEKIQWEKLFNSTPIKTELSDKYRVRQWVEKTIGSEYLTELFGVYDSFDEINFDKLPDKFILKCNHGSGWNVSVTDKKTFDKEKAREKFNKWMSDNYAFKAGFELQYRDIKPKIIAEQFLIEPGKISLTDYKFFCSNGDIQLIAVLGNRDFAIGKMDAAYFTKDWEIVDNEKCEYSHFDVVPSMPTNFEEMKSVVLKLCADFDFVRVDLYNIENKIYFGEMTFSPESGFVTYSDYDGNGPEWPPLDFKITKEKIVR